MKFLDLVSGFTFAILGVRCVVVVFLDVDVNARWLAAYIVAIIALSVSVSNFVNYFQ